jgi:lipase
MRLNATAWGERSGDPLICLHGVTGHGRRFERLAGQLPARRVIGFDLRGHGHSGWEPPWGIETHLVDLLDTVDALGVERSAWLGHSFGGRLVAELATIDPDRVERAVLLDPAMHVAPAAALEQAELQREDLSFADADEAIDARLASGSLISTPRATLEVEAAEHLERGADGRWRWRYAPPAVIAAFGEMATPSPPWPVCPTLLVVGAQSWLPVDAPEVANVEVLQVPGGHSVLWDDFDATAEGVVTFLDAS